MGSVGKDRRYALPAETRTWGGKKYTYLSLGNEADVKRWKAKGYNVRTAKWRGKTAIYLRK